MSHLGTYLSEKDGIDAPAIYQEILTWLRSPEGIEAGGLMGMMNRAEINMRLRTGMADELQKAIMPAEEGSQEAKICSGCSDEIFCVSTISKFASNPSVGNHRVVDAPTQEV